MDAQDKTGSSALLLACQNGEVEAAQVLIKGGAKISLPRSDGFTALMAGAQSGYHRTVSVLIQSLSAMSTGIRSHVHRRHFIQRLPRLSLPQR